MTSLIRWMRSLVLVYTGMIVMLIGNMHTQEVVDALSVAEADIQWPADVVVSSYIIWFLIVGISFMVSGLSSLRNVPTSNPKPSRQTEPAP